MVREVSISCGGTESVVISEGFLFHLIQDGRRVVEERRTVIASEGMLLGQTRVGGGKGRGGREGGKKEVHPYSISTLLVFPRDAAREPSRQQRRHGLGRLHRQQERGIPVRVLADAVFVFVAGVDEEFLKSRPTPVVVIINSLSQLHHSFFRSNRTKSNQTKSPFSRKKKGKPKKKTMKLTAISTRSSRAARCREVLPLSA